EQTQTAIVVATFTYPRARVTHILGVLELIEPVDELLRKRHLERLTVEKPTDVSCDLIEYRNQLITSDPGIVERIDLRGRPSSPNECLGDRAPIARRARDLSPKRFIQIPGDDIRAEPLRHTTRDD